MSFGLFHDSAAVFGEFFTTFSMRIPFINIFCGRDFRCSLIHTCVNEAGQHQDEEDSQVPHFFGSFLKKNIIF